MLEWITKYWLEVLFSGIIGVFAWILKNFKSEMKHYQELLNNEEKEAYDQVIDKKLQPIHTRVTDVERNIDYIIDSYRFRIITLCQLAIDKGYMSQTDFDQLTEMFKLYTSLQIKSKGDNSDYSIAAEYYTKAKALPIKSYDEIERIRREKEHLEIQRIVKEEFEAFKLFLLESKKEGTLF